jgi:competence protein ComEA
MLSKIKTALKLNKSERNGILVLFALLLLIFVIPQIIHSVRGEQKTEYAVFEDDVKQFLADTSLRIEEIKFRKDEEERALPDYHKKQLTPFVFDPNKASDADWLKMGFSEKQTKVIMNFVNKGGHFYKPEDVANIYSISEKEFDQIKDYIKIEPKNALEPRTDKSAEKTYTKKTYAPIDINTADSVTLVSLPGIGPSFASRIIKYRNRIGGFARTQQLMEVYGFDEEKFSMLESRVNVGQGVFAKINLNTATVKDLQKLPYLDFYMAKAIIDRRISRGKYTDVNQVKDIPLIYDQIFDKMKPYLTI